MRWLQVCMPSMRQSKLIKNFSLNQVMPQSKPYSSIDENFLVAISKSQVYVQLLQSNIHDSFPLSVCFLPATHRFRHNRSCFSCILQAHNSSDGEKILQKHHLEAVYIICLNLLRWDTSLSCHFTILPIQKIKQNAVIFKEGSACSLLKVQSCQVLHIDWFHLKLFHPWIYSHYIC